eukprot:g512.t1
MPLRVKLSGRTAVLPYQPSETLSELTGRIAAALGVEASAVQEIKAGFPPRPVQCEPAASVGSAIADQECLIVVAAGAGAGAGVSVGAVGATGGTSAAKAKTTAKAKAKGRAKGKGKAKGKAAASSPGQVHTLFGGSGGGRAKRSRPGPVSASSASSRNAKAARHSSGPAASVTLRSKEDTQDKLLRALSGGAQDAAGQFLRAATRSALEKQYEQSRADARFSAAQSGRFECTECEGARALGSGGASAATRMSVRYKGATSGRKWEVEEVDILREEELAAVVAHILQEMGEGGRELLKPFKMAEVSPRVFWGLARRFGGDVVGGLRALVPSADWSFLGQRAKRRSAKALPAALARPAAAPAAAQVALPSPSGCALWRLW